MDTTGRITPLPQIHQRCWEELSRASHDKQHAWRVMALATVAAAPEPAPLGSATAELRCVVLREVDEAERTLVFFTDARSPKVAQMLATPQASLMVWCAALGWQLRLAVRLEVHTGGLAASSYWARLKLTPAAQDYLSPLPPGAPLDDHGLQPREVPPPERASRNHFAVVHAQVQAIDWLELHADGHRRAAFDALGRGQWLVP